MISCKETILKFCCFLTQMKSSGSIFYHSTHSFHLMSQYIQLSSPVTVHTAFISCHRMHHLHIQSHLQMSAFFCFISRFHNRSTYSAHVFRHLTSYFRKIARFCLIKLSTCVRQTSISAAQTLIRRSWMYRSQQ